MYTHENFLFLAKKQEKLKEELSQISAELTNTMLSMEVGSAFQDPETLAVYKIVKPKGTFMYYKDLDYVRTSLGDESSGTLSKKEALSLGFVLSK